jgi:hypothetical protein
VDVRGAVGLMMKNAEKRRFFVEAKRRGRELACWFWWDTVCCWYEHENENENW